MDKTVTGVPGLDEITNGGLPKGRLTLITGDAGAGKTVLAMQILVAGAAHFSEPGVFVSFEEHADEIATNFESFGWTLATAAEARSKVSKAGAVVVIDASLPPETINSGAFDVSGLLAAVSAAIAATSARRVVFDGIDMLLDQLDDPRDRRRELVRLREWTRSAGVTAIITAKASPAPSSPQDGSEFLKYLVSCVIALEWTRTTYGAERMLRALKVRGSSHSTSEHPAIIRADGFQIGAVGSVRIAYAAPTERVSSGMPRLDHVLGGGYFRGSSILISGAPGTAKSTLCGAFLDATCARGERGLFISFDEAFSQIERNLASVNIRLGRHVDSGLLATAGLRTGRVSSEELYYQVMDLIEAHDPKSIVIDPITAIDRASDGDLAGDVAERLIDQAKMRGATIVITSFLSREPSYLESTRSQISGIADTWLQLSFSVIGGERNRGLTVIKSRGNAHSNQVRELILSDRGLELADVYAQGGAILMGTARMEQELRDQADEALRRSETLEAEREIDEEEARLKLKLLELEMQLKALERRKAETAKNARASETRHAHQKRRILERRAPGERLDEVAKPS